MTSAVDYPRVLIVAANPISRVQSAGLMMRSLFTGWPKDRLAQVYFPAFHSFPPDTEVCTRYLRVNPFGVAREDTLGSEPRVEPGQTAWPFRRVVHKLSRSPKLRAPVVDPLREALALYPWLDRRILAYARSFKPDVVYTLLGTLAITRTVALMAVALDRPVVPHFTDNWIDTRFEGSLFGRYLRGRLSTWMERVLERSPAVFAMSGAMAEAYASRFQKECRFLTTLVDQEPYLRAERSAGPAGASRSSDESGPQRAPHRPGGAVRLVYAGSLALNRGHVLHALGRALETLQEHGLSGTLEIYCSDEDRRAYAHTIAIPGVVMMKQWVPAADLPELLVGADVLVHVENPDPTLLNYTRYAFSTKLSQYMMAGRCLLLVGPLEAGSMQEILRMGGGVVVESTSQQLQSALRRVLGDSEYRETMGRKARALALEHFEATRHREKFRRALREAADRSV